MPYIYDAQRRHSYAPNRNRGSARTFMISSIRFAQLFLCVCDDAPAAAVSTMRNMRGIGLCGGLVRWLPVAIALVLCVYCCVVLLLWLAIEIEISACRRRRRQTSDCMFELYKFLCMNLY